MTRKYGAAARTNLKGAVLCRAIIVSHCLSVICVFHLLVPLVHAADLATNFVNDTVPGKASIIDDDVDLSATKFSSFFD